VKVGVKAVHRIARFAVLVVAAWATLARWTRSPHAQEKRNIRLVSTSYSWTNDLAFRVGRHRGYFKNQGIAIEPILIRGGPIALAALVAGEVDFATGIGVQAPIRARARGLDLVVIGSVIDKATYGLVGNRETRTLADMKGKVVGVTGAGAFSDFVVRTFLKRNGIDPDRDVTLRAVGSSSLRAVALERALEEVLACANPTRLLPTSNSVYQAPMNTSPRIHMPPRLGGSMVSMNPLINCVSFPWVTYIIYNYLLN